MIVLLGIGGRGGLVWINVCGGEWSNGNDWGDCGENRIGVDLRDWDWKGRHAKGIADGKDGG